MSATRIVTDELAYEPEVVVEQVYRVTCDGGCNWEIVRLDARRADIEADQHRAWHKNLIDRAQSDMGPCVSCDAYGEGVVLREASREGGLPWLSCRICGGDW